MAYWIDRLLLWGFVTSAAFFMTFTLTNYHPLKSSLLTFAIVIGLRFIVRCIPLKRFVRKKDKLALIQHLLKQWALMDKPAALKEISLRLPDLAASYSENEILLLQRIPYAEPLDTVSILEIWRTHQNMEKLLVIATCPSTDSIKRLIADLAHPRIELIDSTKMIPLLLPGLKKIDLSIEYNKKERSPSFSRRFALWIQAIRPVKCLLYAVLFTAFFLINKSRIYAFSAGLLVLLAIIHTLFNRYGDRF